MAPKAVLVGMPGSGKSTIGRRLSKAMQLPLLDTDTKIVETTGRSIADIFVDGEPEFRRIEENVVRAALAEHDGIVSLGGGAITSPGVRDALAGHTVIYLEISAVEGVRRTTRRRCAAVARRRRPRREVPHAVDSTGAPVPGSRHHPGEHQPPQPRRGGALHHVAAGKSERKRHAAQAAAASSVVVAPRAGIADAEPFGGHHARQSRRVGPPCRGTT